MSKKLNQAQGESNELIHNYVDSLETKGKAPWEKIKVGDKVTTKTHNLKAVVTEKHEHNKTLTLQAGLVKTTVGLDEIFNFDEAANAVKPNKAKKKMYTENQYKDGNKKPKVITKQCDVRGLMLDDAIGVMGKFLDEALMDKESIVAVVHGVGTGSLKNGLRAELAQMGYVSHYYPAPAVEGGDGKTIIEL